MSPFATTVFKRTYALTPTETWPECARRVAHAVATDHKQEEKFFEIIRDRIFMPGGRYLFAAGREITQFSNCFAFVVEDTRESWADTLRSVTMCLSMGGGLGINYSRIRERGRPIKRMGGVASGPISLMHMVNEIGRHVMMGGARRSALWAGLNWDHPDIDEFIKVKDWDDDIRAMKAKRFEYPAPLDMHNVSVIIDDGMGVPEGGSAAVWPRWGRYNKSTLWNKIVTSMARHGEPGIINMTRTADDDPEAISRNACAESTLEHAESCNLGSIVMPRIRDLSHLEEVTRLAIQFLYNGSRKATYPTKEIEAVVSRNRRLGLGVIGLHEWMLLHGERYEVSTLLGNFMKVWAGTAKDEGKRYADALGGPRPRSTRAIAPTGTISIVAESTSGIEPIYCLAYRRRYLQGDKHLFQYVVDPTARRLMDQGVKASHIEDTYALSRDLERRLSVQADIQDHVDQAISNTVNLPEWGTAGNNNPSELAAIFSQYMHRLKGLTVYPNNSRSGQPLSQVSIEEASESVGVVFEEEGERNGCANGVCGL